MPAFPLPIFVAVFFCWISILLPASSQPANDDFADAREIVVDQALPITVTGNTVGATVEAGETALDPSLAASVWYRVTSPGDGVVRIDTQGSSFATRLAVTVGAGYGSLVVIAADDDPEDGTAVVFEVEQDVEYHIVVSGSGGETGDLSLSLRETEDASISGHVTAQQGGGPLGQVTIQALAFNAWLEKWQVIAETATNGLGGYTLSGLPTATDYRIRAADPTGGLAPRFHPAATFANDATPVTPDPDGFGIDLALPPASSISGQVGDGPGSGLGGITVAAYAWSASAGEWLLFSTTTSDPVGTYTLAGLPPETYRLSFSDAASGLYLDGYFGGGGGIDTAQDIVVAMDQVYPGTDAELQLAGQIHGLVTVRRDGSPAAGVLAQALAWDSVGESWEAVGRHARTAEDGTYVITALPYDSYKVAFASFDDALQAPGLHGGTTDPDAAVAVILTGGSPVASGIDHVIEPVAITGIAPAAAGAYSLELRGNPYAQFVLQSSPDLGSWETRGLPFNPALGIAAHPVDSESGGSARFWRLRGPAPLGLSPQPDIHQHTSHAIGQEHYRWVDRRQFASGGFLLALGFGDFNGDGSPDALAFPGQNLTLTPVPAVLTLNLDGGFVDGSAIFEGGVPGGLHPRKLLVGDLNGDGVDDAVMIDHGYDAEPFPGAPLQVLLSAPGGKIVTVIYPEHTGFHHAGALGDVDHDGDLDLFLASPKDLGDINLILLNDGLGNFTPSLRLVGDLWEDNIWASEFFDLDGDGFLDLAIGGSVGMDPASVLWGSSLGTYGSSALDLDLPTGWEVYDYDAEDLDQDGDRDLLVTLADLEGSSHQFRLFINEGNRGFVDATFGRFDDPGYPDNWIDFVHVQDVDDDGDPDIVTDITGNLLKWENDGTGHFARQP